MFFASFRPKLKVIAALGLLLPALMAAAFSPAATASAATSPNVRTIPANGNRDLNVTLQYGTGRDMLLVRGANFPAWPHSVKLALLFSNGRMTQLRGWKADRNGTLNITLNVTRAMARYPAGTMFRVVATGGNGFKQVSSPLPVRH
jgi:hypothetical protein